jgi:hypothetical protein
MNPRISGKLLLINGLVILLTVCFYISAMPQYQLSGQEKKVRRYENKEDNKKCLKCHNNNNYSVTSADSSKTITRRMYTDLEIDSNEYYYSNHRYFKCIDCHSDEYFNYPHNNELRFEDMANCMDCHDGDPQYEKYNFKKINEDFNVNIHSEKHKVNFSCWSCHNPHTYATHARTDRNMQEVVAYDNGLCLECHANRRNYKLMLDKNNPNLVEKHDWLPNQARHFKNVRCIECHTKVTDSLLVSHHVRSKNEAVHNCVECHSGNTLLMATLYKYQSKEGRSKNGFFNAIILNESYVIGANRNYYLNIISVGIFGLVVIGIVIHSLLRLSSRNSYRHGK